MNAALILKDLWPAVDEYTEYSDLEVGLIMANAAAITCFLNALLNYPTYWNMTLPILFGVCYKSSYKYDLSFNFSDGTNIYDVIIIIEL